MTLLKKTTLTSDNTNNPFILEGRENLAKAGYSDVAIEYYAERMISVLNDYAAEFGEGTEISYISGKRWGRLESKIFIPGKEYDPFEYGDDANRRKIEQILDPTIYASILGVVTGIICLHLPEDANIFILFQCNDWIMNTMRIVLKIIPVVPFLSLATAIGRGNAAMLALKTAANVVVATFMMTEMMDVPISLTFLFVLIIITFEMSLASPGTISSWVIAFETFSLPTSYVGLFSTYRIFTNNYATGSVIAYNMLEQYEAAYRMNSVVNDIDDGNITNPENKVDQGKSL